MNSGERRTLPSQIRSDDYRNRDFLPAHTDDVSGRNRRSAYALGLTPHLRAEWGGLLLSYGGDGEGAEGHVPAFHTLSLFAVPHLHSVRLVAPWADGPRLSVTGWLRASPR